MTQPKKREKRQNRYDVSLKRKLAKSYLNGEASYGVLAEEHGLKNKEVVKEFVRWYLRQMEKEGETPIEKISSNKDTSEQIKTLQAALRRLELKAEALETMIDIAEKELNIDIRKKSGTKRFKK